MTRPGLLEWPPPLALVFLGAIGALFTRRVAIRRRGGTFDCSLRLTPASETGTARAAAHFGVGQAGRRGEVRTRAHANTHTHAHSPYESGQQPAGSASAKDPA